MLGLLVLSVVAYLAGNRHCATDQFGRGCGHLRWAAVQIKRKGIAMYADTPSSRPWQCTLDVQACHEG